MPSIYQKPERIWRMEILEMGRPCAEGGGLIMPSEKDLLLSIASAEEWWRWADDPPPGECLLCKTYDRCDVCKDAGGHNRSEWCVDIVHKSGGPNEAAARRLIRAGIERPKGG